HALALGASVRVPERYRPRDVDEGALPRVLRGAHAGDVHGGSRIQVSAEDSGQGDAAKWPPRRRLGLPAGEPGRRAHAPDRLALQLSWAAVARRAKAVDGRSEHAEP